jgi:hypothetical protein
VVLQQRRLLVVTESLGVGGTERALDLKNMREAMHGNVLVDLRNIYSEALRE